MKNFKILFFLLVVLLGLFLLFPKSSKQDVFREGRKSVAVSTFVLYDIVKHIAQESIDVEMILPFGVDPHSFEPTPKLMAKIMKSDLLIYSGAGLEPWSNSFDFSKKLKIVDMSKHVHLIRSFKHTQHENYHHHQHGAMDPHYWFDIENMIKATDLITKELVNLDPQKKEFYLKNKLKYTKMLKKLNVLYKDTLKGCKKDTIIVNHNAFSYLSKNYGFHVESLSGLSPDAQSDAKSIIKVRKTIQEHNISTVFFESFASDKMMKTISKDEKIKVDILDALGNIRGDDYKKGLDYEAIMLKNLKKISDALECG